jgi:hypothetical protein
MAAAVVGRRRRGRSGDNRSGCLRHGTEEIHDRVLSLLQVKRLPVEADYVEIPQLQDPFLLRLLATL